MIPNAVALGGWSGEQVTQFEPVPLSTLNRNYRRFPDTYATDYASFLRDPETGKPKDPLASLSAPERQTTVAIIGTGMSGLVAGYELARCGIRPLFIEATDRVGGRAYTQNFASDPIYSGELGAMRIPSDAKLVWHYYSLYMRERTGKPDNEIFVNPFPNPGIVPTTINFGNLVDSFWNKTKPDGQPEKPLPPAFAKIRNDFAAAVIVELGVQVGSTFVNAALMNKLMQQPTLSPDYVRMIETYWSTMIERFADVAFIDGTLKLVASVPGRAWNEEQVRMFAALGLGTGGFGPLFSVSFLDVLRIIVWDYAAEFQVEGGLSRFAITLLELTAKILGLRVDEILRRNTPVTDVAYDSVTRKVVLISGSTRLGNFDYAIAGMTTRAMQQMGLDLNYPASPFFPALRLPDSDPAKAIIGSVQSSIRVPNMVSASKTFKLLPVKPWNSGDWPMVPTSTGPVPAKVTLNDKYPQQSYWLDPFPTNPNAKIPVLVSYLWANESVKVQAITDKITRTNLFGRAYYQASVGDPNYPDYSRQVAAPILNPSAPENYLQIDWQNTYYYFGGFKLDNPAEQYYTASLAFGPTVAWYGTATTQPWQRLYLSGCTVSFYGGWVEGAMMSGLNAATAILLRTVGGSAQQNRVRSSPVINPANVRFHRYQIIQESRVA